MYVCMYVCMIRLSGKQYKIEAYFLLSLNRKLYALYRMVTMPMILSDPESPQTTAFCTFCTAFHIFITGLDRDFKCGT